MEPIFAFLKRFEGIARHTDLLLAGGLILVLVVMIMPLHPLVLDAALTLSITISLMILLVAVYTEKALDFSVFPTLLLVTTLYRLGLNVATTRLILSEGHSGPAGAGHVVEAFANFVAGNNYVIGFVVFVIFVVILIGEQTLKTLVFFLL